MISVKNVTALDGLGRDVVGIYTGPIIDGLARLIEVYYIQGNEEVIPELWVDFSTVEDISLNDIR